MYIHNYIREKSESGRDLTVTLYWSASMSIKRGHWTT